MSIRLLSTFCPSDNKTTVKEKNLIGIFEISESHQNIQNKFQFQKMIACTTKKSEIYIT